MEVSNAVDALYNLSYYEKFASAFITQRGPGHWNGMGYSVVSLVAVILLFTRRREHVQLKIGFLLLTAFLLLPVAGHVLNGFSYVTNRWVWAYSFLVAFITVTKMPDVLKPTRKQLQTVSIFAALYFLQGLFLSDARSEEFFVTIAILLLLIIFMYHIRLSRIEKKKGNKHSDPVFAEKIIIISMIVLGISVQTFYRFAPEKGNYVDQFKQMGEAMILQTENPSALIRDLADESFFRYETNQFGGQHVNQNSSMLNHQNSTDFFFSLGNPNIGAFLDDISYYGHSKYNFQGLESRAIPGALAGVKYFVVQPGLERYLPYGYEDIIFQNGEYDIYLNKYALPIAYAYDSVISKTKYQALSPIQKQQALLQGAVVDDGAVSGLNEIDPQFNHSVLPYEMECGEGISYENGTFIVRNKESSVKLSFDGLDACETYLGIYNLHLSQTGPIGDPDGDWGKRSRKERRQFAYDNRSWRAAEYVVITVQSDEISRSINNYTAHYSFYEGKHDYMVNLFYGIEGKSEIEITFSATGSYSIDGLEVICQPMDVFGAQIEKLRQTVLENVKIDTNQVTGTISTDKGKLLCFSIPHNGGWRAYIDGKEVELLNVNTMYSGVYLPAGEHEVALRYAAPYIKEGLILSMIGLCLFGSIFLYYEKFKKRA